MKRRVEYHVWWGGKHNRQTRVYNNKRAALRCVAGLLWHFKEVRIVQEVV